MRQDHAIRTKRIEAFRAVMECGSVTAAANALFVTQPAVTKLLAQLERDIGFDLFVRAKGRLTPTPEAGIFYQHVRQTFEALDDLATIARDIRNLNRGSLVVGALPLLSTSWLPQQCAGFLERHAQAKLILHTHSSARIRDCVVSGQVDIGIGMIAADERLTCELLAELEAVCILPRKHPLVEKETITPEDFNGQHFIMTGGVDGTRQKIEGLFKALDIQVQTRFETILAAATCSMVAAGAGVSLVNAFSAAEFAHMGYEIRPFRPKLCFQIHLLTPRTRPMSRLGQQFVEQLKSQATRQLSGRAEG